VTYLDYNATTPLLPAARAAMQPFLDEAFGNPSSVHREGARARVAIEEARSQVAGLLGARPSEIVFTSGGTEANNLAIVGVVAERDGAIVTTPVEHSSVREPLRALERQGRSVHWLRVDRLGFADLDDLAARLRESTALASIDWANNEIGTIQPIEEVARLCRAAGALLHADAVQAAGKIPVAVAHADLLSISAHKIGGPKGVGALWIRSGVRIRPLMLGGEQERGLRAGTENVAGIVGFGAAAEVAREVPARARELVRLRERLWDGLCTRVDGIERNSPVERGLPNTLNVRIEGSRGEAMVAALDLEGIAISTGSACAAGAAEPSHVLQAIGLSAEDARDGLRFSLGPDTSPAEIDHTVDVVSAVVERMRGLRRQVAYA
jgi:cysteine desulfurase